MSALTQNIDISNDITSVTKISAQARIDYILRFSKQAILVIDESVEQNATISNQLLASLPEQHNVAYVALSSQFNNIQIRCRVIEQLYTGELFDPEISLAVSVINLAKKSQQSISIVLDSAQHLSLQVMHELTQLALIAKKANLVVNVVMFGSLQSGRNVAVNKSLFDNKLSLLSSQSGQLLSTTSAIFKKSRTTWALTKRNKWLLGAVLFCLAISAVVINLLQLDSFNFTQSISVLKSEKTSLTETLEQPQTMVFDALDDTALKTVTSKESAIPEDIYSLLVNPKTSVMKKKLPLPATPLDIIYAITIEQTDSAAENVSLVKPKIDKIDKIEVKATEVEPNIVNNFLVDNNFYAAKAGYVIQLSAFSDLTLPPKYLAALATIEYHIYQRQLNDKPLMVITSKVYTDKASAQVALSSLPESLLSRQPWIKPTSVVNNEINAFQLSQ